MTRRPATLAPLLLCCIVVTLAFAAHVAAASAPGASLERCQAAVRKAGARYVQGTQKAVATCLGRVATDVLKRNAGDVGGALAACTAAFHKIGRTDGRSLADKLAGDVTASCAPAPANAHTLGDLLGELPTGAPQPLFVRQNLDDLCRRFGGDGSVDDLGEWLACVRGAHDCAVRQAIATEFPRAAEWLEAVVTALPASGARDAAIALEAGIDGASDDGVPDLQCGTACGDGVRRAAEQCDGSDLGGATCEALGFASGTIACAADCSLDVSGCTPGVLATGQQRCFGGTAGAPLEIPCTGTQQDGDTRTGQALAYVDNGDGTITDGNTRLVWEKKSDDGSLHDKDRRFPWAGRCAGDDATLCTSDASCAVAGGPCENADSETPHPGGLTAFEWLAALNAASFAGHSDWRLPNARELETLVDRDRFSPVVAPVFDANCGPESIGNPSCTVLTCSCTVPGVYWTSSTYVNVPSFAWGVFFNDGVVSGRPKDGALELVRAVRGGS